MNPGITPNIRPNITFMRVGVGNIDTVIPAPDVESSKSDGETWTINRLSTIIKILNHTNVCGCKLNCFNRMNDITSAHTL